MQIVLTILQVAEWEAKNARLRMKGWWSDYWNKLDVIVLLLFLIGTALRFFEYLDSARIILASDLFILYFRLLEYLTSVKNIGPKVLMIGKMVRSL